MKKKLLSLLLALCLVMALVPMTVFAEENEQSNKTSITTVDELLQFAKAVDNGEYDDKTDAVVSLDADLDLTGIAWKPIGSVFDLSLIHILFGEFPFRKLQSNFVCGFGSNVFLRREGLHQMIKHSAVRFPVPHFG